MIRVSTPSRLHFGLLSFPRAGKGLNGDESPRLPARHFGGAGLMVEAPGASVRVQPAADWSARGPLGDRALAFAREFTGSFVPDMIRPHELVVELCAWEHVGLGTGTQLGLAVARALALSSGLSDLDASALAWRIGRGRRSALGIHGFAVGGFLVDGGKRESTGVAPLIARLPFPEAWRVLLIIPLGKTGLHGSEENQLLDQLVRAGCASETLAELSQLILLGLLPAVAEGDLTAFGEALFDYNRRVGRIFAPLQGGDYASPQVAELIAYLRRHGVQGVGQSSWGPVTFAVVADEDVARHLVPRLREHFRLVEDAVLVTRANNQGARVERRW